jgi:hypothetical protein
MVLVPPPNPSHMETGRELIIATQIVGIQIADEIPSLLATSLRINHQERASEASNMSLGSI